MAVSVQVKKTGTDTSRGLSSNIWSDCPIEAIRNKQVDGIFVGDDFVDGVPAYKYDEYKANSTTITQLPLTGGIVQVGGNGTDNDEGNMQQDGAPFVISSTSAYDLWFEARVKKESITDEHLAFFIGLGEESFAADTAMSDDEADLISKDLIGFHCDLSDGDALDIVYGKATGGAADVQTVKAAAATLVADTYIKLGFKVSWGKPGTSAKRISFFINGVEQSTYVTDTLLEASTFPDGEELAMLLLTKVGTGAAKLFSMDWWYCSQIYEANPVN